MVKIVICGAGISGLSAYLLLQKHLNGSSSSPHEIKIYEAYDIRKPSFKNNDAVAGTSNTPTALSQDLSADEAVPTPQTIGGGIGISKNGLNVLSRMENSDNKSFSTHGEHDETSGTGVNSGLIKEMTRRGHPIERWEISTARGWTIVDVNLIPRHLRDPSTSSDGGDSSTRRRPSVAKEDRYMYHSVMIARQACWEILRDRVLDHSPDAVVKKRIVGVVIGDAATSNTIKFEDGTEDSADLVIGADGLRSVVRKAMFETDKINAHSADVHQKGHLNQGWAQAVLRWLGLSSKSGEKENSTGCDYITPHYEGLVGVGGFVPSSLLESTGHKPGTMSIVFGPNGFFGYGYLTSTDSTSSPESQGTDAASDDIKDSNTRPSLIPGTSQPGAVAGWWSTFSSPTPYPYATATGTTAGITSSGKSNKPTEFNKPLAVRSLVSRHRKWKNPAISAILHYVESSSTTTTTSAPPLPPPAPTHSKDDDLASDRALDASYPTWTTPELPHWTLRGRAVLVGDAAHALQPSSGQGACQALEDAEALALLLKHHLKNTNSVGRSAAPASSASQEHASTTATASATTPATAKALATALAQYEALRKPRVHAIYTRSQKMSRMKGDMGPIMEWTMYLMIYIMTWFRDDYNEVLFEYDLPSEVEKVIKDAEERGSGS